MTYEIKSNASPHDMSPWLTEKSQRVVESLAAIAEGIKSLQGPSSKHDLNAELMVALFNATKILAFSVGGGWKNEDAALVFGEGADGVEKILVQYDVIAETNLDAERRRKRNFFLEFDSLLGGTRADCRTELHSLIARSRDLDLEVLSELLDRVTMHEITWDAFVAKARAWALIDNQKSGR